MIWIGKLLKHGYKCDVDHPWRSTSASMIYEVSMVQVNTFYPFTLNVGSTEVQLRLHLQALLSVKPSTMFGTSCKRPPLVIKTN